MDTMTTLTSSRRVASRVALALAALAVAACSLDKQAQPALSGPSGLGLNVTMSASPDQLPRDGSSQSVVTITARDAQGRPVAGQRFTIAIPVNAPAGTTLSETNVVTGAGGTLSFAVTAPVAGSLGNITIVATPVGTDSNNTTARTTIATSNDSSIFWSIAFVIAGKTTFFSDYTA